MYIKMVNVHTKYAVLTLPLLHTNDTCTHTHTHTHTKTNTIYK